MKRISLIVDGKPVSMLEVTKKNKIRDIKSLLENYQGKKIFYVNQGNEIPKVFEVDTYDNMTLESVWNKMINPSISINTLAIYPLGNQQYLQQFSFTGNMDIDRAILENLSDKDILMACSVNKFMYKKVCNDSFFQRLVLKRFPTFIENTTATLYPKDSFLSTIEIPAYKDWRDKYLNIVRYIDLLKREFNYEFKEGDPRVQYLFLKEHSDKGKVAILSLSKFTLSDEPELIKYVIEKEGGIQLNRVKVHLPSILSYSIDSDKFKIAEYLMKQGVKLNKEDYDSLLAIYEAEKNTNMKLVDEYGGYDTLTEMVDVVERKLNFLKNL